MQKIDWTKVFEEKKVEIVPTLPEFPPVVDLDPWRKFRTTVPFENRFYPPFVEKIINEIVNKTLDGKIYTTLENPTEIAKKISNTIQKSLQGKLFAKYKYIVQVILGEHNGAGVKVVMRYLWDKRTDNYASVTFQNNSMFCVATVYGIFNY